MSKRFRNDFINEESFGVEINPAAACAATTVAMDNGFTFTAPVAGTCVGVAAHEPYWLYSHTAGAAELGNIISSFAPFNMVIGKPIRFIADITPVQVAAVLVEEFNIFLGCQNDMIAAGRPPTITAGGGMGATGQHFGFYTPDSSSAVFATPANWFAVSMHNDIQQITELTALNSLDRQRHFIATGVRQQFQVDWVPTGPVGGTTAVIFQGEVQFRIDGVLVARHQQNLITPADTDIMQAGIVSENITDILTYQIRQLKCRQLRALSQFGG